MNMSCFFQRMWNSVNVSSVYNIPDINSHNLSMFFIFCSIANGLVAHEVPVHSDTNHGLNTPVNVVNVVSAVNVVTQREGFGTYLEKSFNTALEALLDNPDIRIMANGSLHGRDQPRHRFRQRRSPHRYSNNNNLILDTSIEVYKQPSSCTSPLSPSRVRIALVTLLFRNFGKLVLWIFFMTAYL